MVDIRHIEKFVTDYASLFPDLGVKVLEAARGFVKDGGSELISGKRVIELFGVHADRLFGLLASDTAYRQICVESALRNNLNSPLILAPDGTLTEVSGPLDNN